MRNSRKTGAQVAKRSDSVRLPAYWTRFGASLDIQWHLHTFSSVKIPSPVEMQLLALVTTERSGREVALRYKEETGKSISYGTLYTTFRRLKEAGWVDVRDDADEDGRIRFFLINGAGVRALEEARAYFTSLASFGLPMPT